MFFWNLVRSFFLSQAPDFENEPPLFTSSLSSDDYGATFVKMFLTLIGLIALLWISFWFLRRIIRHRLQRGAGTQEIYILEKRMISPKSMLYLLEVDGKKILLAESHLEVRQLHLESNTQSSCLEISKNQESSS